MSLFLQKHAVENNSSSKSRRKRSKRSSDAVGSMNHLCRFEPLEKREYLAADPISVGVVYTEQYQEDLGDRFYVAWVGGEESTTLDSITINLDKNGNGSLDEGEAFFDVTEGGLGVYSAVPFTVVDKTSDIGYDYSVEDGGTVLTISFTNFHAGDHFVFQIDLDEYQLNSSNGADNAQVEGGEMGGSVVNGIDGSRATAVFSSDHYQTETWAGMFVDDYDGEYNRSEALSEGYDRSLLPYDVDDGNSGIDQAGVYDDIDLTPKPITISGYVYADHDVDCNYDLGEDEPLANVNMTLVDQDGNTWTTTTDVNGYYEFVGDDLMPGTYQVYSESDIVSPEGWQYFDFCAKGGEYGEKISALQIEVTGMQGGDDATQNNFAKVLESTIEGYVFEDRNDADGKNEGESWDGEAYPAKIELWRIDYDSDGNATYTFMDSQTVDAEGHYKFMLDGSWNDAHSLRMLPEKTYEIREIFSSEDYTDGKDYIGTLGGVVENDVFTSVYVGYGENGYDYDFGELKLGSIAGNVWEDRNDNGLIDRGEAGIAGVTVELYQWDGASYVKIDETKTDENGAYQFDDLDIEKEYAVKELQPSEYDDGKDAVGTLGGTLANDYLSNIEIGWDDHGYDYNFGELKLGSIAGNVYEDRNDNGILEENEPGIGVVTVELYQWDGSDYVKIAETETAEDGSYSFDKLDINKEYAVREKQPADYSDGKDTVGTLGGEVSNDYIEAIDVQWDDHGKDYNFGELKLGSVSGYVYNDVNDNGIREEGEAPISDVTVELYRLDGDNYVKIDETKTDENGFYKFDSLDIEQTYAVKEIQPTDWRDGKDTVGTLGGDVADDDYLNNIRVLWDQHGEEYNFGELVPTGSISGFVYEDNNNNGVKEDGEDGITDVAVDLYVVGEDGKATLVASQKTNAEGYYEFTELDPGRTYIVRETQPTAYYDGKDAVGTIFGEKVGRIENNDEIVDIDLPNNGEGVHYDFGELKPASISGFVYEDLNDNGIKESGEPGIPSTVVTLQILNTETGKYEDTGRILTTDSEGYYIFDDLEPARIYRVVETQPSGYNDGKDTVGSLGGEAGNDVLYAISVKPGDAGTDYNFGELKPKEKPYIPDGSPNTPGVSVPSNLWGASPTSFPYTWYQPVIPGSMTTLYGGGGGTGYVEDYSFKLSVINGGDPRFDVKSYTADDTTETSFVNVSAMRGDGAKEEFADLFFLDGEGGEILGTTLNKSKLRIGKVVVGDWDGDGKDDVGVFFDGNWYLLAGDWSNQISDDQIKVLHARLGDSSSDQPIAGDWDGDGKSDIAVFGRFHLEEEDIYRSEAGLPSDLNEADQTVSVLDYYSKGDQFKRAKNLPLDGSAEASQGLASSRIILPVEEVAKVAQIPVPKSTAQEPSQDSSFVNVSAIKANPTKEASPTTDVTDFNPNNGRREVFDHVFKLGAKGDVAISGDWNGDGRAEVGVFRNGDWILDLNGDGRFDDSETVVQGKGRGAKPVVGDWNGDGFDELGYFNDKTGDWWLDKDGDYSFSEHREGGKAGDEPVAGDWNGDGVDEIGVYRVHNQATTNQSDSGNVPASTSGSGDVVMNK